MRSSGGNGGSAMWLTSCRLQGFLGYRSWVKRAVALGQGEGIDRCFKIASQCLVCAAGPTRTNHHTHGPPKCMGTIMVRRHQYHALPRSTALCTCVSAVSTAASARGRPPKEVERDNRQRESRHKKNTIASRMLRTDDRSA